MRLGGLPVGRVDRIWDGAAAMIAVRVTIAVIGALAFSHDDLKGNVIGALEPRRRTTRTGRKSEEWPMRMNRVEIALMNNPIRRAVQRTSKCRCCAVWEAS